MEPAPLGCLTIRAIDPGWNGARVVITPALQQKKGMRAPDTTKLPAGTYRVKLVGDGETTVLDTSVVVPSGSTCVVL